MLNFYQNSSNASLLLKSSTVKSFLWSPQATIPLEKKRGEKNYFASDLDTIVSYGIGWFVVQRKKDLSLKLAYHTGGACGATSCLLVKPEENDNGENAKGVVVAVLCNSQDVSEISKFTMQLASIYADRDD